MSGQTPTTVESDHCSLYMSQVYESGRLDPKHGVSSRKKRKILKKQIKSPIPEIKSFYRENFNYILCVTVRERKEKQKERKCVCERENMCVYQKKGIHERQYM